MELTGLDHYRDKILEVACIVTNKDLVPMDAGVSYVVKQPETVLSSMNPWCIDHHGKVSIVKVKRLLIQSSKVSKVNPFQTGLTDACRNATMSISDVERELLTYLSGFVQPKENAMAGNSVYMDRLFMRNEMQTLDDFLHYRLVDVSTIKELCRRWQPKIYANAPKKRLNHRALADIQDSIEELKYYQKHVFIKGD